MIISKFLVNNTVNAVIAGVKGYRKGKSRDYLLQVLQSFLVRESVKTGMGVDIEIEQYCFILLKSVQDRIEKDNPVGIWRELVLSLLQRAIREKIGVTIK